MTAIKVNDGLYNVATGIGTRNDKATFSAYSFGNEISQAEIEAAYRTSSWFRKIVEIPVNDSIRNGVDFKADDAQIEKLEANLKRLKFWQKFKKARIMARRDGGAVIVMGLPGRPDQPIDPENITLDSLKVLTVLNRNQITPVDPINVILDENFNEPGMYELAVGERTRIHPSRVLRFVGNERSDVFGWSGWGDSIYPPMKDAIRNADTTSAAMAHMMHEANVDVMGIPDLTSLVSTAEYEALLMKRITTMAMLKSLINVAVIDAGDGTAENPAETLTKQTYNFAGLSDILASQLMVLSGICDIPATRLLGKSPDGMNASGDGDLKNYYDNIAAQQRNDLSPILDPFFEVLIRSTLGSRPKGVWYEWSPLYTLTEKEAAEVESAFAKVITEYANNGMIREEILSAIALNGMIERGQFPGIDQAISKFNPEEIPALDEPSEEEIALAQSGQQPAPRPRVAANDAIPKSLYVSRKVKNSAAIVKWAQSQGIPGMLPGAELHVTIVYSREPLDWMKTGESWNAELKISAGGARVMEVFNGGAIVLSFVSGELSYRHGNILEAGGSHDFPDYQPHITIGYTDDPDFDISGIEPYQGVIELGPEIFEELRTS